MLFPLSQGRICLLNIPDFEFGEKKYNLYNTVRYRTQTLELGYQSLNLGSAIYYLGILGKILNLTITQFSPLQNGMIKIPTSKGC